MASSNAFFIVFFDMIDNFNGTVSTMKWYESSTYCTKFDTFIKKWIIFCLAILLYWDAKKIYKVDVELAPITDVNGYFTGIGQSFCCKNSSLWLAVVLLQLETAPLG